MMPPCDVPVLMYRPIHRFDVLARNRAQQNIAGPEDFTFANRGEAAPDELQPRGMMYGLNLRNERAIYTELPDDFRHSVFAAPFLYGAQLDQAQRAWSVPFERLFEVETADPAAAPVFIFSPGRTGSTLLARLVDQLAGCGASEPDTLTRLAIMTADERPLVPDRLAEGVVRASVASLARFLGPAPVIKLRSQCSGRADLLMAALPDARAVFLLRNRAAFARSRHRAFGETPGEIMAVLAQCVAAIAHLAATGPPPVVLWYEDMLADPFASLTAVLGDARAGAIGAAGGRGLAASLLAGDAQEGSGISRAALAQQGVPDGFAAACDAAWDDWRQETGLFDLHRWLGPIAARLG